MFKHGEIVNLNDYFLPLSERKDKCIFFYRIAGYSNEIAVFLKKYYETARKSGVIIDGRIPNPDANNFNYFAEIMGSDFRMEKEFFFTRLKMWLPRISDSQRGAIANALHATLQDMLHEGKNENMIRNAYSKYMCWLYYRFERIVRQLAAEHPPKILYDGAISSHELRMLGILAQAGTDIVIVEREGDQAYLQLDPSSEQSKLYQGTEMSAFPSYFNLKWIHSELAQEANRQRLLGPPPSVQACTNAWLKKPDVREVLTKPENRGEDKKLFYNAFILQRGVEDKLLFSNDLFSLYKQLKSDGRRVCVVNGGIAAPTPDEISAIKRQNYANVEQLAADLARNISYSGNIDLHRMMARSFIEIIIEEAEVTAGNIQKIVNKAVYLLAWLKRYQTELFSNWKMPEIPVFVLFGKCSSHNEILFLRMIAKLPLDVVVLLPDLKTECLLCDPMLLDVKHESSLPMDAFPVEQPQMRVSTAAYQAERDLDELMYQDSGIYRNQQYAKADVVTLQATYEEIFILWDQELKYRPSFSVLDKTVTMPVILEKICGVKDGNVPQYWLELKKLITPETLIIRSLPWISDGETNPVKPFVTQFLQNGKLQKNKIKNHATYQYGILRPEIQAHLLDKLQIMLDQRIIAGTYQNGTEYTIVANILNLHKDILRMIQKFDFTKKNPKLVIVNTSENVLSLDESILVAFLNLVGFDIVFFVPTGYQCVEKHFQSNYINEHQAGEYLYDLTVPDLNASQESGLSFIRKIFGRST